MCGTVASVSQARSRTPLRYDRYGAGRITGLALQPMPRIVEATAILPPTKMESLMTTRHTVAVIAGLALATGCADPPLAPSDVQLRTSIAMSSRAYDPGEQQPMATMDGTWAIYPADSGQVLAQTFTPRTNGWLGYLELPVGCDAGVLLDVKIRDGLGGPILYEMSVFGLPARVDTTFQLIQVYDPAESAHGIKLRKDHQYAFELSALRSSDAAAGSACAIAKGPAGNSYAGGRGYYWDPINGPNFLALPDGAPTADTDLPFITLVR